MEDARCAREGTKMLLFTETMLARLCCCWWWTGAKAADEDEDDEEGKPSLPGPAWEKRRGEKEETDAPSWEGDGAPGFPLLA